MSRETDSSSSGPQGRGGAAYPSGTPPYGSRQYPSPHPAQDAPEETPVEPDEPRTETTLTTRIRINIPGSRPIPPVVMRTPMGDVDPPSSPTSAATPSARASAPSAGPRVGRPAGEGEHTGSPPRPPEPKRDAPPAAPAAAQRTETGPGEDLPPASDWFAPRKSSPGPVAASAAPSAPAPGGDRPDLPYFTPETPQGGAEPPLPRRTAGPVGAAGPSGPTTGPVTGSSPFAGPGASAAAAYPGPTLDDAPAPAGSPYRGGPVAADAPSARPLAGPRPADGVRPPGASGAPVPPRMSDDTAVLTPQTPAPGAPAGGNVSGDTLTSGVPVVPSAGRPSPFATTPIPHPDDRTAAPATPTTPPATTSRPSAKQGRSKLVLASVGVVGLVGVAYGAGLLMNHSDVPKGTTVLGVDIGGGTREEAAGKLDAAFGKRAAAPLVLTVDGKQTELPPSNAGLTLDSQETVRGAAGSDYNPVSVIGSLFGRERVAEPVIPVDEEKLSVALADLAGNSGTAGEGTIKFVPGKAVAVPGKAGKQLDVARSMISVKDAYRAQVETGRPNTVELPVVVKEPSIGQVELDRAMAEFATPAMSGLITIKAGGKQIQFGPERSLPKILSMKPIDGRLVDVYNKPAIEQLLEGVFDGVEITKGDGNKYPVTADDVAQAMRPALLGKTPADRIQEISLNPN
ncbi:hypothetical protein [Streptomyces hypolithicus]